MAKQYAVLVVNDQGIDAKKIHVRASTALEAMNRAIEEHGLMERQVVMVRLGTWANSDQLERAKKIASQNTITLDMNDLDVDDDAFVSEDGDGGVWVQAWLWLADSDADDDAEDEDDDD